MTCDMGCIYHGCMSSETFFRPRYHITPPQGRLNDPNGVFVSPRTGRLHVFYQHDPAFPFGKKRTGWGHVSAELDTLRWLHHPDALYPDVAYDLDGCYSGGAVVDGEQVYLFYTGNLKEPTADGGFARRATQNRVNAVDPDDLIGGLPKTSCTLGVAAALMVERISAASATRLSTAPLLDTPPTIGTP